MMGQILCEKLEWDSNFFEFSIARVIKDTLILSQIEKIDHWCSENHIRCLYFLANACDAQTITLAESHGFHFVDIRMTFDDNVGHIQEIPLIDTNDVVIRPSRLEDLQALKEIAKKSYYKSRFYFDVNFPRNLVDLLYITWIEKSIHGYADQVLVADLDEKPCGFTTCRMLPGSATGQIGLVGVNPGVQGHGIGKRLVFASMGWFRDQGVKHVSVVTQGRNIEAQRLYQGCGFRTRDVQLWYHKWYIPR